MIKRFTILLIFVGFSKIISSQTWQQKASMFDYGRRSTFGCSLNGKGYTGCGIIFSDDFVNDFWEYDPLINSWSRKPDYPGNGYYENTCFTINGKVYVCLGLDNDYSCQNDLWEFNPISDMWIKKADYPGIPRYGSRAFVIGNNAFIIGGSNGDGVNYLFDMYMYSQQNDSWSRKANFPGGPRAFATAFSIDNFGYFGAGISNSYEPKNDFWRYNPVTNSWSSIPDYPGHSRNAPISFVIQQKAYVGFGGVPYSNLYFNDFATYDPIQNLWHYFSVQSSVQERGGCIGFSIGDIGYIGLGINSYGILPDFWSFNPDSPSIIDDRSNNFVVYPNPASKEIVIESDNSYNGVFYLYDISGKEIITRKIACKINNIDIHHIPSGVYCIKLINKEGCMIKKIIKN